VGEKDREIEGKRGRDREGDIDKWREKEKEKGKETTYFFCEKQKQQKIFLATI